MDKAIRNAIERATQQARKLLEKDFSSQLEGTFDVLRSGVASKGGAHLSALQHSQRDKIVAAIEHKRSGGMTGAEAVTDYVRDVAFTALNRFVALKMLEARELVQECITKGEQSAGYREFCGMAPGIALLPEAAGYRLYIESLFDEFSTEIKVLFDRRDAASVLWPKRQTFEALLTILNTQELSAIWGEDETIGWVYQFFNIGEERKKMREESQAPRNSRELAVRNQFFTPRYVVQFLADNTLGLLWVEMHGERTRLNTICEYLVRAAGEPVQSYPLKDPRELRILDPACGSGHFLLYSFDLLLTIYEESWSASGPAPRSHATDRTLRDDYPSLADLRQAVPHLILENNLYGIDIDPRCVQIAALALWLRAQRAWKDLGIPGSQRPRIHRTHIVVAEPMPGDTTLVDEFAARLNPPLLRDLFKKMVGECRLAGELGALLQVDNAIAADLHYAREQYVKQRETTDFLPGMEPVTKQGILDLSGIDDDRFFHEAETLIIEALRSFAETADGGASVQRRLFAGDAAQGIALIDILRTRFDVVLMNPPFGAGSLAAKKEFEEGYPRTKNDVYAAFVERGIYLLRPHGLLGAITSRTGFFLSRYQKWREDILIAEAPPVVFADLGYGVMDAAMVEAAAYCLKRDPDAAVKTIFLRVLEAEDKATLLLAAIHEPERALGRQRFEVDSRTFASVQGSPFSYWVSDRLRNVFRELPALEGAGRTAQVGVATGEDERFVRAWWGVQQGIGTRWFPFAKGGAFSPFYADLHLLVDWLRDGNPIELSFVGGRVRKALFFRPGLTWPRRTNGLSVRPIPSGCIFSDKSPTACTEGDKARDILALAAIMNSRAFGFLVSLQLARTELAQSYEVGLIQNTPIPNLTLNDQEDLAVLARRAWSLKRSLDTRVETSHAFTLPALLQAAGPDFTGRATACSERIHCIDDELASVQAEINDRCFDLYGIDEADRRSITRGFGAGVGELAEGDTEVGTHADIDEDDDPGDKADAASLVADLVSWAVGVALGRFDVRLATGACPLPATPEPFDPLPLCSPAMLTGDDDLPLISAPAAYPVEFPVNGTLVDDLGHARDLTAMVRVVFDEVFKQDADLWWNEVAALLDPKDHDLRAWLTAGFFEHHLKRHSRSRRKAPIVWQLAVLSGRYSIWVYAHRLTRDSFFQIQNDVLTSKLAHEERQLRTLVQNADPTPSAKERREIVAQEAFVEELRTLLDEVKRVAPLWNPVLDDGVVLTMSPLWRLVPQHKGWQKELKSKWNELAAGKCDWAHLAMHLWPERVVPKCATDHSLAIAHGLEDLFWVEGDDGKWKPRVVPIRAVDELVRERTSIAVKAALKSLLEAPAANGNGGRGRGRRVANAVADGGSH
jgi:hypothetical protein